MHFFEISDVLFCAQESKKFLKVQFLRFPTPCSAHRSPRIPESPFFERQQKSAPGSEAARDKWFLQKKNRSSGKSYALGSEAARDKWLLQEKVEFLEKFCPRQRSCTGQVASSKKIRILRKKFCPRQRSCPGQVACSKKSKF